MITLMCMFWVMSNGFNVVGQAQEGMCFHTDAPARAYVVNVNGRGWEPTDKAKCTRQLWNNTDGFVCHVRFAKVYFGFDVTLQLADADNLAKTSAVTTSRIVWTEDDLAFRETPMLPGFNDQIDSEGTPPARPTGVRVRP